MRRAQRLFLLLAISPLAGVTAQAGPLKRTLIDSFVTSSRVAAAVPVFNRQRIYYVLSPDTLMLYDIASKRFRQIGIGQWGGLNLSRNGDLLVFSRQAEGTKTSFIWTLPVNPVTGLPTGPVRRASMSPGNDPAISADGRWIAFVADSDFRRLTVIPAAGGRERDLLHGSGTLSDITWADNDAQLFFTCYNCTTPKQDDVVQRISASGGAPVTIDDRDVYLEGVSPDGARVLVGESSWPWREPIVLDRNGKGIPTNAIDTAYITHNTLGWLSATQALEWGSYQLSGLMSLGIDGGTPREVIPASVEIGRVSWSSDGTRFAALHSRDRAELLIASGDGANRRIVPLPTGICCASLAWSPDSRSIVVSGWGAGQRGRIVVVDATTGAVHLPPTSGFGLENPRWKSDSKHLLYFSGEMSDSGSVRTIHETSVDGPDRLIRTLPRRFNGNSIFASDTTAIAVSGPATYLYSLTSDRTVSLYQYQGGTPTVSPHGDLIVTWPKQRNAMGGARRTAEVISLTGTHVTTISFPGIVVQDHFTFTPDQRSVIGTGLLVDGKCCVVYQGFLDGTPTKVLTGDYSSARFTGLAISPDGRTLLYPTTGLWVTVLKAVEALNATKTAAPRE